MLLGKIDLENKYLAAVSRFHNMVLLGISNQPLSIWIPEDEKRWHMDYEFHISCIWRIRQKDTIIAGYQDIYTEIDEDGRIVEEETESGTAEGNARGRTLFEKNIFGKMSSDWPLKILGFYESEVGDIRIEMEKGYCFEAFPTSSVEERLEEWRFIDVICKRHYIWPKEKQRRLLLLDKDNTDFSQLLEMILQEMIQEEDLMVISAGICQGEKLSKRVLESGRCWYGVDLEGVNRIHRVNMEEAYDYVVPLGVPLPENKGIFLEEILNYQKYVTTGDESRKELENMGKEICEAIGCDYEISDKCREKREKELKKYKDLLGI